MDRCRVGAVTCKSARTRRCKREKNSRRGSRLVMALACPGHPGNWYAVPGPRSYPPPQAGGQGGSRHEPGDDESTAAGFAPIVYATAWIKNTDKRACGSELRTNCGAFRACCSPHFGASLRT